MQLGRLRHSRPFHQLPVNGSVADRIPTCCEGQQDGGAMPVGPDAAMTTDDEDNEVGNTQFVGGVVDLRNQEQPEVEHLRQGAAEAIRGAHYEQNIVSVHIKEIFLTK